MNKGNCCKEKKALNPHCFEFEFDSLRLWDPTLYFYLYIIHRDKGGILCLLVSEKGGEKRTTFFSVVFLKWFVKVLAPA